MAEKKPETEKAPEMKDYEILSSFIYKAGIYTKGQKKEFTEKDAAPLLRRSVVKLAAKAK